MLGYFCLAELGISCLLVQLTFEVVPYMILGFSGNFCIGVHHFWPSVTRGGWVVGSWDRERGGKTSRGKDTG